MARLLLILALAVTSVGVLAAAAPAITNGELDGDRHPYAGAIVVDGRPACSAVLVSPTVVVTAGHCISSPDVSVSFDSTLNPSSWTLVSGTAHVDSTPGSDLAVVVLDRDAGVEPAQLPREHTLEQVRSAVAVGYGYFSLRPEPAYDGQRRFAELRVKELGETTAVLQDHQDGSVCFGDSGGPQLAGDTVVAITLGGTKNCKGKSQSYRLDTMPARSFLRSFVAVP